MMERKGNSPLVSLFHLCGRLLQVASRKGTSLPHFPQLYLRDCNNTDLPHRDVVRLFMCKALGKVPRDEYYYHLDLMSSLFPRALRGGEDDHLKWHLGAAFSYVASGKQSGIHGISVVLEQNRDEGLKRIQLLGQTNVNIPSPGKIPAWLFVPKGKTGNGNLWWSQKTVLTSLNLQPKRMF